MKVGNVRFKPKTNKNFWLEAKIFIIQKHVKGSERERKKKKLEGKEYIFNYYYYSKNYKYNNNDTT